MEERILKFIAALRAAGVRISLAESADAFKAIQDLGIKDRENFRISLQTTLVKDSANLPIFHELFPIFFGNSAVEFFCEMPTNAAWPVAEVTTPIFTCACADSDAASVSADRVPKSILVFIVSPPWWTKIPAINLDDDPAGRG